MKRFMSGVVVFVGVVCAVAAVGTAASPTTQPSGAELFRKVVADERWIDEAKSFHVLFADTWTKTPYGLERSRAEAIKESEGKPIDESRDATLWPGFNGWVELAFDDKRWRKLESGGNFDWLSIWNGQFQSGRSNYPLSRQNTYYFSNEKQDEYFWMDTQWARMGNHRYWFVPERVDTPQRIYDKTTDEERAGECELFGREMFRGVDCYVVIRKSYPARLFIGVDDGRLRGFDSGAHIPADKAEQHWAKLARKFGAPVTDRDGLTKWEDTQPMDVKNAFWKEHYYLEACDGLTSGSQWMDDYREVAPGQWFPMTQGYEIRDWPLGGYGILTLTAAEATTRPCISLSRELRAVSVTVDQPLPDALFEPPAIPDGVEVVDRRRTPMLLYKHKRDMTPAEWAKIYAEADARQAAADKREAEQNAALAKPPPAFGDGRWHNSPPLTWEALRGKVVLVDCFADWCAPCRNDYPRLVALAAEKRENLVVLGLHTAGSDEAAVKKLLEEFKITYPVHEDTGDGFGRMFKALGCSGIPHTFVIGPDGRVAAHGMLHETLPTALKLATPPTSRPAN
ncbi:MAG TPA: TlpA disulfide reductase family protein [Tepidisphaeraceae bacterium]|jgi:thiol-disulfide isomerase/thioredoxin